MEPKSAQTGRETQKRFKRAFSLPYFSHNLHYTKFILCKNSPPLFWSWLQNQARRPAPRCTSGIKKAHPSLCRAQMRGALFIILNYRTIVRRKFIRSSRRSRHSTWAGGRGTRSGRRPRPGRPGPGLPRSRRSESWCRKTAARSAGPRFPCTA